MPNPRRVVILGGGISGLATAHALLAASGNLDITIVERSERVGGNIMTEPSRRLRARRWPRLLGRHQASRLGAREVARARAWMMPTVAENRRVYIACARCLAPAPRGGRARRADRDHAHGHDAAVLVGREAAHGARAAASRPARGRGTRTSRSVTSFHGGWGRRRAAARGPAARRDLRGGRARALGARGFSSVRRRRTKVRVAGARDARDARGAEGECGEQREQREQASHANKGEGSAFVSLEGGLGELVDALAAKVAPRVRVRTGTSARRIEAGGRERAGVPRRARRRRE